MSIAWHYMKNGVQTGPATTDDVKSLIASGAIKADTLVWRDGLASWVAANTQADFAGVLPPAAPPSPAAPVGTTGGPGVFIPDAADVEKNKVFGILAYLGILWLVPLLAAKDSPFARYHCNQGLVLFLGAMCVWFACLIVTAIPFLNLIMILLWPAFGIVCLVFAILGIVNAVNGVCKPLPLIGNRFTLIK
jgi:uncharacterized membrane protein